jgi:hypothetical protein
MMIMLKIPFSSSSKVHHIHGSFLVVISHGLQLNTRVAEQELNIHGMLAHLTAPIPRVLAWNLLS